MRRLIITSCGLAGGMLLASLAVAQPGIDMQLEHSAAVRPRSRLSLQAGTDAALDRGRQMRRRA